MRHIIFCYLIVGFSQWSKYKENESIVKTVFKCVFWPLTQLWIFIRNLKKKP